MSLSSQPHHPRSLVEQLTLSGLKRGAAERLLTAVACYELPKLTSVTPLTEGLIHQTFALDTSPHDASQESTGEGRFIFQRLHPQLNTQETLEDYEAVTAHLAVAAYGAPQLIKTREGQLAAEDHEGGRWRLSTFVPGVTRAHIEDSAQAGLAGRSLATFHRVMRALDYEFKSPHPGHDTRGHWERLRVASERAEHATHWEEIRGLAEPILSELQGVFLPSELPKIVVHGDPKVTNLRFQEGGAVLIDLDTCARHTRLVDLGDAVRSWCDLSREGASTKEGRVFSLERCRAVIEGYLSHSDELTELERAWLPRCMRTITLELAARFARDYLEDHYFAFDASRFESRRAHNLHRVGAMWRLAEEMREAEAEIRGWL